tara:strand:- start:703 stop:1584 length:882 start_codon:yes stop_codon:yes gene_type:complete
MLGVAKMKFKPATKSVLWTAIAGAFFATLVNALPQPASAQGAGDLVVAPTRVVLEGRTRSAQLGLVNKGSTSATYRISVINMRMGQDGGMVEIAQPDEGQAFADKLFRYSPRQITLAPGASQAIRILLRKPKDLAPGEYRSHLMMRAVPDVESQSVETPATGAAVRLIPVFGIAIPVIVRHGEPSFDVAVSELTYLPKSEDAPLPRVKFNLDRTGDRSAFGDLTASIQADGKDIVVARVMRLAVYTPNNSRTIEMPLRVPEGVSLNGKTLKITYRSTADEGEKLIAEGNLQLP